VEDSLIFGCVFLADVKILPEDLKIRTCIHRHSGDREYVDFFLTCTKFEGKIVNKEPDKCVKVRYYPVGNLPSLLIPYVRRGIENSLLGVPFSEEAKISQTA